MATTAFQLLPHTPFAAGDGSFLSEIVAYAFFLNSCTISPELCFFFFIFFFRNSTMFLLQHCEPSPFFQSNIAVNFVVTEVTAELISVNKKAKLFSHQPHRQLSLTGSSKKFSYASSLSPSPIGEPHRDALLHLQ